MIPQEYIQEVVRRNDIEEVIGQYVQLQAEGPALRRSVSLPQRENPSFVDVTRIPRAFYCFGCGAAAMSSTLCQVNSIDYVEAVKLLAARGNAAAHGGRQDGPFAQPASFP